MTAITILAAIAVLMVLSDWTYFSTRRGLKRRPRIPRQMNIIEMTEYKEGFWARHPQAKELAYVPIVIAGSTAAALLSMALLR